MGIENVSGQLRLLRVHDRGTKFGPPNDQIDVEVVVQFVGQPPGEAYGMQLREDANKPAREGMLGLLRDGFNHNWIVNLDFNRPAGRKNVVLFRVWLTKPAGFHTPGFTATSAVTADDEAQPATKTAKKTAKKRAKKAAKKRTPRRS